MLWRKKKKTTKTTQELFLQAWDLCLHWPDRQRCSYTFQTDVNSSVRCTRDTLLRFTNRRNSIYTKQCPCWADLAPWSFLALWLYIKKLVLDDSYVTENGKTVLSCQSKVQAFYYLRLTTCNITFWEGGTSAGEAEHSGMQNTTPNTLGPAGKFD